MRELDAAIVDEAIELMRKLDGPWTDAERDGIPVEVRLDGCGIIDDMTAATRNLRVLIEAKAILVRNSEDP